MPPAGLRSRKPWIGEPSPKVAQQLDLGVRQLDEDRLDAVLRLVLDRRDVGAQHVAVLARRGLEVGDGDRDVVQAADHSLTPAWGRGSFGPPPFLLQRRERGRSQARDLDLDDRPAVARQVERLADGDAGGLAHPLVVAGVAVVRAPRPSRRSPRRCRACRSPNRSSLDRAQGRELRLGQHAALVVEDEADHDGAVVHQPAAGAEQVVARRSTKPSASTTTLRPTGTWSITSGSSGASRSRSPFSTIMIVRHAQPLGEALVGLEMARLAVDRDRDLAAGSSGTSAPSRRGRVARDVDEVVALGDHLDALADELVVQVVERPLVAGDDLGAEDHGVAGLEPHPRVLAAGDRGTARSAASPWLPVQR